jgi:hypothetical protein
MGGPVETTQAGTGLDEQSHDETEQYRARHDDGRINQCVAQCLPEGRVGEQRPEIRGPDEIKSK